MSRWERIVEALRTAGLLIRAGTITLGHNWALGLFSIAAAFLIWFAVEDVDNPREEGLVPVGADQRIRVETVNVPDGLVALEPQAVQVRVRARADEIPVLGPADFRAWVDLRGLESPGVVTRNVRVEALRDDVRVLAVQPNQVQVIVEQTATKEVVIKINENGSLPEGFRLSETATVDPVSVVVSGPPDLVNSVDRVEASVNLTGQRDELVEIDAPLVAKTASGNIVTTSLSPPRAKVTLRIEQINRTRVLSIKPALTGSVGPGFQVTGVTVDPATVEVTGPTSVIDSLSQLTLQPVDITNATRDVVGQNQQIVPVPNVTFDRQTVQVTVKVQPTACDGNEQNSCFTGTCFVGPTFEQLPAGLIVEPGTRYSVQVVYLADRTVASALKCEDLKAVISLAGASAGPGSYTARVTGPASVTILSVEPITVRLIQQVTTP